MHPHATILLFALGLLTACSSLPERDFFSLLPEKANSHSTTILWHNDFNANLSWSFYRKAQHAIVDIQCAPELRSKGYRLVPMLARRAYGSLWGRTHEESLSNCLSHNTADRLKLCIPAARLRHSGGPWDYQLRFNMLSPDGKILPGPSIRLNDTCPEPGALRHNPDFFDSTYSRNSENLQQLQQAAAHCTDIRIQAVDFHSGHKVNKLTSKEDCRTLCRLISHMQPIQTQFAMVNPAGTCTLHLLGSNGEELATIGAYTVAAADEVSPESVALMKRYCLSNEGADTWFNTVGKYQE